MASKERIAQEQSDTPPTPSDYKEPLADKKPIHEDGSPGAQDALNTSYAARKRDKGYSDDLNTSHK